MSIGTAALAVAGVGRGLNVFPIALSSIVLRTCKSYPGLEAPGPGLNVQQTCRALLYSVSSMIDVPRL